MNKVHILTLGCARNDVDSEELAGRLEAGGFQLVDDPADAQTVVVNTCGFVEQAKKDSIDTLLAAADLKDSANVEAVVAVGCMAERYGVELARELPEADAVLGFDDYTSIADRLRHILAGGTHESHVPRDRRTLLPLAPAARPAAAPTVSTPGHAPLPEGMAPATGPRVQRRRISGGPAASLKIASGCDRRCAFCAIPAFRGSYLSRPVDEIVTEARWLASEGVKEILLVSENTSSYGKDLPDASLERLLPELADVEGLEWIRVSYLQPAEIRPSLLEAMFATPKVLPYFDLSFQHASPAVLRRMRRFGDPDSFLSLIGRIRAEAPEAGIRSNVIAGFPGETEADVEVLRQFIIDAGLDVLGVFGYSDEEGTEGAHLDGHLDPDEIEARREALADIATQVCEARAADRVGEQATVLIEEIGERAVGRAEHQGPETDGTVEVTDAAELRLGDLVAVEFVDSEGIDLTGRIR
ncbi:30S ribosomal protein S12 methylthiotransferase RimO [Arachnia propionica]|uniref:Ribosomal protein uS12 methylthiotransferase RimO n=2 Tax=Arachnia propionica TaxID=1750 RepID=A0A3P1WR74_9ACTN|nr:30S ribosomal protein S12 methylthiotransferase RimO [Arachnia propionica]